LAKDTIREIQTRWDDAWNRHDVKALAALVADDVRFVNVAGVVVPSTYWSDRLTPPAAGIRDGAHRRAAAPTPYPGKTPMRSG